MEHSELIYSYDSGMFFIVVHLKQQMLFMKKYKHNDHYLKALCDVYTITVVFTLNHTVMNFSYVYTAKYGSDHFVGGAS